MHSWQKLSFYLFVIHGMKLVNVYNIVTPTKSGVEWICCKELMNCVDTSRFENIPFCDRDVI